MAGLPTGTVTFLFTDIEGSTRLLQELGERYVAVRDEHAAIVRQAVEAGGGVEVSTEGDSFFVAFASPQGAVRAAVAAQRSLATHGWPAIWRHPRTWPLRLRQFRQHLQWHDDVRWQTPTPHNCEVPLHPSGPSLRWFDT